MQRYVLKGVWLLFVLTFSAAAVGTFVGIYSHNATQHPLVGSNVSRGRFDRRYCFESRPAETGMLEQGIMVIGGGSCNPCDRALFALVMFMEAMTRGFRSLDSMLCP